MDWKSLIIGFKAYLILERSLSGHSVEAYIRDVKKLHEYLLLHEENIGPKDLEFSQLEQFIHYLNELGVGKRSQARIISGIKSFYKYLLVEDVIDKDPTELLEGPKLDRKIPDVLSVNDVELIFQSIDLSTAHGTRNRAILETLYASGLRVSELINLKISNYFPQLGFIKVLGKNNKERIVPIGQDAMKHIQYYIEGYRMHQKIDSSHQDFIFLNRRGKRLTREMIFLIVKDSVTKSGLKKNVSPHTFRHSFATHLVEGGADLRAVQDMLGHESITTTEIYTHLDKDYLRSTLEKYHPRFII